MFSFKSLFFESLFVTWP